MEYSEFIAMEIWICIELVVVVVVVQSQLLRFDHVDWFDSMIVV